MDLKSNSKSDKHVRQIRSAIYYMLAVFVVTAVVFGVFLKQNNDAIKMKDMQISTLVGEVGEVKEQLDKSILSINHLYDEIADAKKSLVSLNDLLIAEVREKEMNWQKIQAELLLAQNSLNGMLREKEDMINNLAYKNELLKQEAIKIDYNDEILDVLILGHNAKLVDTIILASVNPATKKINLISIPRDLYHKGRKINELYNAYGITELENAVAEVTGVVPDKYVLFDFNSFIELIDELGGINIFVDKAFEDNAYPGTGNSYIVVKFDQGEQLMDGDTALKYARSRKSTSDFDRAARQHKVITAVRDKVLELDLVSKLDLATKIYASISENISSDISFFDALGYVQGYRDYQVNGGNIISSGNLLYSTKNAKGQYILLPIGDSYLAMKQYVQNIIVN